MSLPINHLPYVKQSMQVFLLQVLWKKEIPTENWKLTLWYHSLSIFWNAAPKILYWRQINILKRDTWMKAVFFPNMSDAKRELIPTFHWKVKETKWLPTETLWWSWSISIVCLKRTYEYFSVNLYYLTWIEISIAKFLVILLCEVFTSFR